MSAQSNAFGELPGRLFLDTSTLQALQSYGEFIYDGGAIPEQDRIWAIPNGPENVDALRKIMFVGRRASFELVLSSHSLDEVADRGSMEYLQWAFEIVTYWDDLLAAYAERGVPAFTGVGEQLASKLVSPSFGYLSNKDRMLLEDAVWLECEAFVTMDLRLARNAAHLERHLPIRVLEPVAYWELLQPWAPLFA